MFPCWRGVAVFSSIRILSLKFYQASGRAMVFYNFCLLWSAQNSAHSQHRAWIIINTILYFQYTKFECCRVNQSCIVKFLLKNSFDPNHPLLDSLESFIKYSLKTLCMPTRMQHVCLFLFWSIVKAKMEVLYHTKPGCRRAVHHGRQRGVREIWLLKGGFKLSWWC